MQSGIEALVKLVLVALLVLTGVAVWLLPKTGWVRERRISGTLFAGTCIVGILCGAGGLVVTFAWPGRVLEWHLWELAVMPLVLMYAYWFVVMRRARTTDILDEKQNLDMIYAGAFTFAFSIVAMSVASVLHEEGLMDAALYYPYFLFLSLMVYSATTLYSFRRR